jgi:hypothetical protein
MANSTISVPATTFTWVIANLERETADGFVFTAHYTIDAADGTYNTGAYGSIGFERPENLIPFADLTESVVVGWVQNALGAEKVAEIEAALQAQLDEQHAPSKAAGVPWVNAPQGAVVKRARNADGTFIADDSTTPDTDEAWVTA